MKPIRFSIHGDVHGFRRIPKEVLERFVEDSLDAGCQFVCFLGDSSNGGYPVVMSLSICSPITPFYQHGDHEFFGEWSIGGCSRNYVLRRTVGTDRDPLIMAMGGVPRCEAWDGLPRFWSMTWRGIHFVFAFNGKHEVWTPWFLAWLRRDLDENGNLTTVILSHRGLDEDIGMEGSSVETFRRFLKEFPQVKLLCAAHIHRWGFRLLGDLVDVRGEADWESGWYVIVEIGAESIRIFHRNAESGEMKLKFHRSLRTSLTDGPSPIVSLPFLLPDRGIAYLPVIRLRNGKMRVWGFEMEQLIRDPFFEEGAGWRAMNGAEIDLLDAPKAVEEMVGLKRMARVKVESIRGSEEEPVKICHIASLPIRFDERSSGESGSYRGGTVYDVLVMTKMSEGRRLRLLLETYTEEGQLESRHFVDGVGGGEMTAILGKVGMIFIPGVPFRWMGLDGKGEVDGIPRARRATRLEVYLAVPEEVEGEEYLAAAFAYPHEGFYMPVEFGVNVTEEVRVTLDDEKFEARRLHQGEFRQFELRELMGGEEIRLKCAGSKLAIVEISGEAAGLMHHLIRRVKRFDDGRLELGELVGRSQELLEIPEFNRYVGVTALTPLREMEVDGKRVKPFQNVRISPSSAGITEGAVEVKG
jgi:hypothetical protein